MFLYISYFFKYIVLSSSNSLYLSIYPSLSMLCSFIWIKYKFIDLHKMYYPQFILCCIFSCFLSLSYFLLILTINYVLSRLFDWLKLKVCFKIAKLPIVHKNIHFKICFSYYKNWLRTYPSEKDVCFKIAKSPIIHKKYLF